MRINTRNKTNTTRLKDIVPGVAFWFAGGDETAIYMRVTMPKNHYESAPIYDSGIYYVDLATGTIRFASKISEVIKLDCEVRDAD